MEKMNPTPRQSAVLQILAQLRGSAILYRNEQAVLMGRDKVALQKVHLATFWSLYYYGLIAPRDGMMEGFWDLTLMQEREQ
jgi:hypothetical protein